jgi:alpha-L-arabinofuranosidase
MNSVYLLDCGNASSSMEAGIEPGRWYDIKIEILGNTVKGYLDGKLVQEVSDTKTNVKSLCASAARDGKTGDIILKIVNASSEPVETQIDLKGAGKLSGTGKAVVLTSASPLDENTLEEPTKVAPKNETVMLSGSAIRRSFAGNSFTVIRLPASGKK